jgi:hypothetical protein
MKKAIALFEGLLEREGDRPMLWMGAIFGLGFDAIAEGNEKGDRQNTLIRSQHLWVIASCLPNAPEPSQDKG